MLDLLTVQLQDKMGQQLNLLNSPPKSFPVSKLIHLAYSIMVQSLHLTEGRERNKQVQPVQPALSEAAHTYISVTVAENPPWFTDGGEYNQKKASQDSSADAVNERRWEV